MYKNIQNMNASAHMPFHTMKAWRAQLSSAPSHQEGGLGNQAWPLLLLTQ